VIDTDSVEPWKAVALAASASLRVVTGTFVGAGAEGADDTAERIDDCEVAQPSGLMALPALTATSEAFCVRRGDELVALFLIDKGAAAQAVESGETRLYGVGASNAATVIRLRADGSIDITSAANGAVRVTANGTGDVVVNGGSLKVARVTDPVRVGTLTGTAGPYPLALTFTPLDADGVPGTPSVGPTVTLAGVVSNAGGAARFKG